MQSVLHSEITANLIAIARRTKVGEQKETISGVSAGRGLDYVKFSSGFTPLNHGSMGWCGVALDTQPIRLLNSE